MRSASIRSAPDRSSSRRGTPASASSSTASIDYWGAEPALERLVFLVVVDARQRLIDLEAGSVDLATSILPDETRSSSFTPISCCTTRPATTSCYLAFNTQHPPFDDVRVRRAANYAINKEPIIKLGYSGARDRGRRPAAADATRLSRAGDPLPVRPGEGQAAARGSGRRRQVRSEPHVPAVRAVDTAARTCRRPSASRA